jgi:hypothetical protein
MQSHVSTSPCQLSCVVAELATAVVVRKSGKGNMVCFSRDDNCVQAPGN